MLRVLTVGSLQRAEKISQYLSSKTIYTSQRGFTTISGYYNSQYVSIVSIGMVSMTLCQLILRHLSESVRVYQ